MSNAAALCAGSGLGQDGDGRGAVGAPAFLQQQGKDRDLRHDDDGVGENERPATDHDPVNQPEQHAADQHQIHGKRQPRRLLPPDSLDRLREKGRSGETGRGRSDEFDECWVHCRSDAVISHLR